MSGGSAGKAVRLSHVRGQRRDDAVHQKVDAEENADDEENAGDDEDEAIDTNVDRPQKATGDQGTHGTTEHTYARLKCSKIDQLNHWFPGFLHN